jgi:hypothetical protein
MHKMTAMQIRGCRWQTQAAPLCCTYHLTPDALPATLVCCMLTQELVLHAVGGSAQGVKWQLKCVCTTQWSATQ